MSDDRSELNLNAYWPSPWRLQVERAERAEAECERLRAALSALCDAMKSHSPAEKADAFGCRRLACEVWDELDAKALAAAVSVLGGET